MKNTGKEVERKSIYSTFKFLEDFFYGRTIFVLGINWKVEV